MASAADAPAPDSRPRTSAWDGAREVYDAEPGDDRCACHDRPVADAHFLSGVEGWIEKLPRLRNVVRQELVAEQVGDLLAGRPVALRVLDAGCGQGTQSLALARAGHAVTGLDISDELLARFAGVLEREPADVRERVRLVQGAGEHAPELLDGRFDLLLCHGVLMYLDDVAPLLRGLTAVAAPGALLSLLVRNGLAPAMREGLRGNWIDARVAFVDVGYVNGLGLTARAHRPQDIDAVLHPLGWRSRDWFGVRVFCDQRDDPAPDGEALAELLAAEREAGRRDPYRSVAALLHLTYELTGA